MVRKIELALQAELLLKLTTKGDGYCPNQLAKAAVMLVCHSEKLDPHLKEKFENLKCHICTTEILFNEKRYPKKFQRI